MPAKENNENVSPGPDECNEGVSLQTGNVLLKMYKNPPDITLMRSSVRPRSTSTKLLSATASWLKIFCLELVCKTSTKLGKTRGMRSRNGTAKDQDSYSVDADGSRFGVSRQSKV